MGTATKQAAMVWALIVRKREWLGEKMYGDEVEGARPRGRPKKAWEVVGKDCQACGL